MNVPDAQQSMHTQESEENQEKHQTWAQQVIKGVGEIISGRRGKELNLASRLDLCICMNLLKVETPLPFLWDIDIYTKPPPLKPPRVPTEEVRSLIGDKPYKECNDSDDDYDDDDLDPIARPEWTQGEVRIIKLGRTPFWAMARLLHLKHVNLHNF